MEKEIKDLKVWMEKQFKVQLDTTIQQGKQIESLVYKVEKLESQVFECIISTSKIEKENRALQDENENLRRMINQLDFKSRQKNLRFFNLPIIGNNTPTMALDDFITNDLGVENIEIEAAYVVKTQSPS